MSVPLGRTLSQNDGSKTTRKAIPSPWNSRLWAAWLSSSGFPYPMLSVPVPFPNKASCFFSSRVSSDNLFPSVRQEPTLRPWKGSPFLQQHCIPEVRIRSHKLRAQFHKTDPTSDSNCKSLIVTWTSDPLSIWVGVPQFVRITYGSHGNTHLAYAGLLQGLQQRIRMNSQGKKHKWWGSEGSPMQELLSLWIWDMPLS